MKYPKNSLWLCVLSGLALAGCDSSGGPGAGTSSAQSISPNSSGNSSNTVGESCVSSDPNKICLAVHFVSYRDSSGNPVAGTTQAAAILHGMNAIWAQCSIGFQIEKYEAVSPTDYGLSFGAQSQNELNQVRTTFASPTDQLLAVTTGPWGTAVNAWTSMPGSGPYGAVMESGIVDYGNGVIYAHEFGHYLGLDHVGDANDLMDAIVYTNSNTLSSSQCQTARDTANSYWPAMLRR